jgi:hypothetical protein
MIYVFKTSVETKREAAKLKLHIDKAIPAAKWNFDLEDVDRILRVDSEENIAAKIIEMLQIHNHHCEELE